VCPCIGGAFRLSGAVAIGSGAVRLVRVGAGAIGAAYCARC